METFALLTVMYGLFNTLSIHLSKAMQDHGIRLFKKERERVIRLGQTYSFRDDMREIFTPARKTYLWIYMIGVILNQTPIIWGTIGGRFGRAPYFTSVFPLGMVILLLYSKKIIHDRIPKMEAYGITAIIGGTLILGIENIFREPVENQLDYSTAWIIIAIFSFFAVITIYYALKFGSPQLIGVIFGSLGGIMGSLDPILKDIGQEYGGGGVSAYIPGNVAGWIIFLVSFIMGSLSFIITQWGFTLDAKAPLMTGFYNTFYLSFPTFLYLMIDSAYTLTPMMIVGLLFNVLGIVLLSNHVVTLEKAKKFQLASVPLEIPEF
ncbi:MAG: hypothetical protein E4G98_02485 [Promethearchaeota archaeon]|nr:MAG: hypothetical protein E4G98_02485 [Candidatus Lokiarchaeota archaeon]